MEIYVQIRGCNHPYEKATVSPKDVGVKFSKIEASTGCAANVFSCGEDDGVDLIGSNCNAQETEH